MFGKLSPTRAIVVAILVAWRFADLQARAEGLELANQSSVPVADSFTIDSTDFHASLFLRNTAGKDAQLTIWMSKLRSADGRLFPLAMEAGPARTGSGGRVSVPQGGTIEITLSGNLPDVGVYRAELAAQSDEKDAPLKAFALSVERKAAALPDGLVEVPALVREDLSLWPLATTFTLNGTLRNSLGRPIHVGQPQVIEVDEKQGAAAYARDDVSTTTTVGCAPAKDPNPAVVRLDTPQRCPFSIVLDGLTGGAVYDVKLSVAGIDSTSEATKTVSVSVRRSWPFALILILIGAVLAALVRSWRGGGRALFAQLAAVATLAEHVAGIRQSVSGDEQRRTVDAVYANISQLKARLRDGSVNGDKADAGIAALKQQADLLLLWLRVEADRDMLSADDRKSIETKRSAAIDAIVTAHDAVDTGAKTAMDDYSGAVRSYLAAQKVRDQAVSFADSVDEYVAALPQTEKDRLKSELDTLKLASDQLRQAIAAPGPDLQKAIDGARNAYVALNVRMLELRVDEPTPAGFAEADWKQDCTALQAELTTVKTAPNVTDKEARLNGALGTLAQTRYARLRALLDAAIKKETDAAKRASLSEIPLKEPEIPMDAPKFELWYALHLAQREAVVSAMKTGAAVGMAKLQVTARESTSTALDPSLFDITLGSIILPSPDADAYAVSKSARRWELATNAIVALLAGLSGLQALWIANFAWGSASDMIIAIFWGAGVGYGLGAGIEDLIRKGAPAASH